MSSERRAETYEIIGLGNVTPQIDTYSSTDLAVLITGETGTGKELVAHRLHQRSKRSKEPFVAENIAALDANIVASELFGHKRGSFTGADRDRAGLFETADKGTLFLDEIGDMQLGLQAKLLRVLESGEIRRVGSDTSRRVDVRLVTATNQDLRALVAQGKFRADLLYRIEQLKIHLSPLRNRIADIPLLVEYFTKKYCNGADVRVDADAMSHLQEHDWPGNIRELQNLINRVCVFLCPQGTCADGDTVHITKAVVVASMEGLPARIPQKEGAREGESYESRIMDALLSDSFPGKDFNLDAFMAHTRMAIIARAVVGHKSKTDAATYLKMNRTTVSETVKRMYTELRMGTLPPDLVEYLKKHEGKLFRSI